MHPSAWRDCPKRGAGDAPGVNLAHLSGLKRAERAGMGALGSAFRAPPDLFGQSRKGYSRKFGCRILLSSLRQTRFATHLLVWRTEEKRHLVPSHKDSECCIFRSGLIAH